jgi:transposase
MALASETICQRLPLPAGLTGNIDSGCYGPLLTPRDHLSPRLYGVRSMQGGYLLKANTQKKGEPTMFYLGIDVSKKSCRYLLLNEEGQKVKSFSLDNTHEAFQNLLERLKALSIPKENLLIGLEASGGFWENLYSHLKQNGFSVVLLNPYHTNKFREALAKKAKTDDIDALVIAQLLRTGEYVQSQVAEEIIQSLREVTKLRYELIKERKNYQRQVFSLLSVIFPEYEKTALKNPFSIASTAILQRFPTAKDLAQAKPKQIEKIVRSIQGNNFNIEEIGELIRTAQTSIYSGRAKEARATSLRILLGHIRNLSESIEKLEEEIQQLLSPQKPQDSFPGENLLTIPGVGEKTLAAILSYLGADGSNFSTSTEAIGYVGYFPKIYQSGQTYRDNTICKRGPKLLRWALYMAAVASLKHNPEMRTLYHKKLSQGKTEKQALICVGKKMLQIMLAMLKSGEPYNPMKVFVSA